MTIHEIAKDNNGYRNYSDKDILIHILEDKERELRERTTEYEELKAFITTENVENLSEKIQYESIGEAIKDAVPGFYGFYFLHHFQPYLQGRIKTSEQKKAYDTICEFWDNTEIRIPIFMKLFSWFSYRFYKEVSPEVMAAKMDAQMKVYLDTDEVQYENLITGL